MLEIIIAIHLYLETGSLGPRGSLDEEAWNYCIKTVPGTDMDMTLCDHKFDPDLTLNPENEEENDGR